jgi:hypothetical protein
VDAEAFSVQGVVDLADPVVPVAVVAQEDRAAAQDEADEAAATTRDPTDRGSYAASAQKK